MRSSLSPENSSNAPSTSRSSPPFAAPQNLNCKHSEMTAEKEAIVKSHLCTTGWGEVGERTVKLGQQGAEAVHFQSAIFQPKSYQYCAIEASICAAVNRRRHWSFEGEESRHR